MNDSVTRFALKTASLIQSSIDFENSGRPSADITGYFTNMGLKPKEVRLLLKSPGFLPADRANGNIGKDIAGITDEICREINYTLQLDEKIYVLLTVQDCLRELCDLPEINRLFKRTYRLLGIETKLMERFREFILNDEVEAFNSRHFLVLSPVGESENEKLEGSWIEDNAPKNMRVVNITDTEKVDDRLLIMFIDQIKSFLVRYLGSAYAGSAKSHFKIIGPGMEVNLKEGYSISYINIKRQFLQVHPKGMVTLSIEDVEYRSLNGSKEIRRFAAAESSGRLIGILGKEGVGKSTLLKLLAAQVKPYSGNIIINGYDLWKYKFFLKGIIGYVPEEDLLFEELTVFDNLALTARLHFSNLSAKEIKRKVDSLLAKLDLSELKNEVVGNIFKKDIQPGQRRILNIALELLREPHILLVDNALYGLSMADSSKVIKILHDYTFGGNLVITTISQPGSDTFSYFDKLWILDEGGRLIYDGAVSEAIPWFHRHLGLAYSDMPDSNPSALLDLVNFRLPDPEGSGIWKRVKDAQSWYEIFNTEKKKIITVSEEKSKMPARLLKIPNLDVQLLIFSIRNFKVKFSRTRDIVLTFLSGPLIGFGISLLLRLTAGDEYHFSENSNIPLSLFISVIVAIAMGLMISADEFTRERNILKKEEYLDLSRFSYINSKIIYLFPLIALQTLLYAFTSNYVLEIKGMTLYTWIVLLSAGCFGVVTGLFYSMSVKRIESVYKRYIPLTITALIILGGGVIPFDNLNLGKGKYSPVLGDLMVSRWGYEALAVSQYMNNKYDKLFFEYDKNISRAAFYTTDLMPVLENSFGVCTSPGVTDDEFLRNSRIIYNELSKMADNPDIFPFEYLNEIQTLRKDETVRSELKDYLTYLSLYFFDKYENAVGKKDSVAAALTASMGEEAIDKLRKEYYNSKLEETVRGLNRSRTYEILNDEVVRQADPVFSESDSKYGRATFFSASKYINGQLTSTIWFNLSVIWIFTFLLYLLLLSDITDMVRRVLKKDI
jgi:ABC transport system ATP-binding/permease protein